MIRGRGNTEEQGTKLGTIETQLETDTQDGNRNSATVENQPRMVKSGTGDSAMQSN